MHCFRSWRWRFLFRCSAWSAFASAALLIPSAGSTGTRTRTFTVWDLSLPKSSTGSMLNPYTTYRTRYGTPQTEYKNLCFSVSISRAVQSKLERSPSPQICLVNDPRPENTYGKLYSVEFLSNMVEGRKTLYNNQPIQLLKKAAADSIKEGEVCGKVVPTHFH